MIEGENKQRVVVSVGRGHVGHVWDGVSGAWDAGSVGHAHDLTLDGRPQQGAQNLHRHP